MDSEDDEFSAAVPRNTEILKAVSARRLSAFMQLAISVFAAWR